MTLTSGNSGGGGGGGGGGNMSPTQKVKTDKGNVITMPTSPWLAPAGAALGQDENTGESLVSDGRGLAWSPDGSARGTMSGIRGQPPATPMQQGQGGDSFSPARGEAPVATTVTQQPAEGSTTVTGGSRSDFSEVLAAQIANRPNRSPARSTNFVSLIGQAGGLGRRADRRTLIGGA